MQIWHVGEEGRAGNAGFACREGAQGKWKCSPGWKHLQEEGAATVVFVFISTIQLNKYCREKVKGDFTAIN